LVEIAKHSGGREFLKKLDKLTVKIQLNTGQSDGGEAYGSAKSSGQGGTKDFVVSRDSSGSITDVKGPRIDVILDFKGAAADRDLNKALKDRAEPQMDRVPASDAVLTGHELTHVCKVCATEFSCPQSLAYGTT
jgi:hypothetical protein